LQLVAIPAGVSVPTQCLAIGCLKRQQIVACAQSGAPPSDPASERIEIAGRNYGNSRSKGRRVSEIGTAGSISAQKRQTTGQGLREHIPKPVFAGGQHENVGRRIKSSQRRLWHWIDVKEPLVADWKI
jgi:hypothetical protein